MASWALPALLLLTCSLTRAATSPEGSSASSSLHGGANASVAQRDGDVAASSLQGGALQGGAKGGAGALESQDAEAAASSLRGGAKASDARAALPFPPVSPFPPISPVPGLPGQLVQQRAVIFESSAALGGSFAGPDRFLGLSLGLRGVQLSTPAAWVLTPFFGAKSTFSIKLLTGISGFPAFLSASFDGRGVELSPFDDGSGRQRWLIAAAGVRFGGAPEVTIEVAGGLQRLAFGRFLSANTRTGQISLSRVRTRSETWLDIPLELR